MRLAFSFYAAPSAKIRIDPLSAAFDAAPTPLDGTQRATLRHCGLQSGLMGQIFALKGKAMRLFWGILGLLLLTLPAHADQIYDVTGTVTLTGQDACGGICVETLNFTLQLDEQLTQFGYALETLSESYNSAGPLPPAEMGPSYDENGEYWPVGFGPGTELDLYVRGANGGPNPVGGPNPFVPTFTGANLYSCGNATCGAEFCPDYPAVECDAGTSVQSVTSEPPGVATPEPQTWSMLWIGLIGLALMKFATRGKRPFAKLKGPLSLVLSAAIFPTAQPGHL